MIRIRAAIFTAVFLFSSETKANTLDKMAPLADNLEIELVVEVSRHGERASKKLFDLTAEGHKNFGGV